jgi:nitroimidazol reductase NimA-like FMN-containing flavoprotein (pyridoxamine 5'-phosphate oxidase superfamily)
MPRAFDPPTTDAESPDVRRASPPVIRDLSRSECEAILARHNVGRVAYASGPRVDIEPINYVYADGWIYCRTSRGTKVAIIEHHHWVAFEVDEVDSLFDWRSVVVRGGAYFLDSDSPPVEQHSFAHGVDLLRNLVPGTGTEHDPVPFRLLVMRVHLDEVTGRAATPGA